MRLSKISSRASAQHSNDSIVTTVMPKKVISPRFAIAGVAVAGVLLAWPITQSNNRHVESVELVGETSADHESEKFDDAGVAKIYVNGEEVGSQYSSDDAHNTAEDSADSTDDNQTIATQQHNGTTVVTVTSSGTSGYGDDGSTPAPSGNGLNVNGQSVDPSRTGRFRIDNDDDYSDNDIRGDIDIDSDNNPGSHASISITISGQ